MMIPPDVYDRPESHASPRHTFVRESGYQLNELLAQPHNLVCVIRYAESLQICGTPKQGEPWSGIVKNRRV